MSFSEIISTSLKYPWKHRSLWALGIFFSFIAGSGNFTNFIKDKDIEKLSSGITPNIMVLLAVVGISLILVEVVLSVWVQLGMIRGTIDTGEGRKAMQIKKMLKLEKGSFWNMALLQIFIPIAIALLVLVVFGLGVWFFVILPKPYGPIAGLVTGAVVLVALFVLLVYLGLVWNLAARFVALKSLGAVNALKEGRRLLAGHGWQTLGLTILVGIISGLTIYLSMLPLTVALLIMTFFISQGIVLGVIFSGALALACFVFFIIISGYFQCFSFAAHTIWWKELGKIRK